MVNQLIKRIFSPLWQRIANRLAIRLQPMIEKRLVEENALLRGALDSGDSHREEKERLDHLGRPGNEQLIQPWIFIPPIVKTENEGHSRFMAYSTCAVADFLHPEYRKLCQLIAGQPIFHRKQWEWIYIVHHLLDNGVLKENAKGLGFGVGTEPLPALFASLGCDITATDAPSDVGVAKGWQRTAQHSSNVESLRYEGIIDRETLLKHVKHGVCDMNAIDPGYSGFDFCWSSCCFEHLGSLEAGAEFVINSVEQTLKPGGVACHTTELNLSSNDETVSVGDTVLYRQRDIEELVRRLEARGHQVGAFCIAPDSHYLDGVVDVPPYRHNPHLKLLLSGYVTTSVGIVIKRGAVDNGGESGV